jgi:hypothetical protein
MSRIRNPHHRTRTHYAATARLPNKIIRRRREGHRLSPVGGPEVLQYLDALDLEPGPNEIVVRVKLVRKSLMAKAHAGLYYFVREALSCATR